MRRVDKRWGETKRERVEMGDRANQGDGGQR